MQGIISGKGGAFLKSKNYNQIQIMSTMWAPAKEKGLKEQANTKAVKENLQGKNLPFRKLSSFQAFSWQC